VDHKIVDRANLIDYLVAFGRVLENLGAFGRIWSHSRKFDKTKRKNAQKFDKTER